VIGWALGARSINLNDPTATAAAILQNESWFRFASVMDIASGAVYVGVTALLFYLLRPVSRSGSLLAAAFGTCGIAIGSTSWVARFASLVILNGGAPLSAFSTAQLETAALIALRLQFQVFMVGMIFFGAQCMIAGYLITRSRFIPKVLGVLLAVGGSTYVISSVTALMDPAVGNQLALLILPVAMIGEGSLTLWLLFKGVDTDGWKLQAKTAVA
jgi:hypothetical protein